MVTARPVAGLTVEVSSRGRRARIPPSPVAFPDSPIRTAADGSFRTTAGLASGSSYRLVVRSPGHEPILSAWTTAVEHPPRLAGPGASGRSGRSPAGSSIAGPAGRGVEVFQAGDGPEPASIQTDDAGRFAVAGFRHGPVLLFARGAVSGSTGSWSRMRSRRSRSC